ncbi:cytochrome c oxidase assembly protein [Capsaspora owczarzaki ATCC 30864]|uniref:Cytochrome c oxidase assembly protein n=1 Tax=Capsaspora owczarzaki (strain ATCC 30864) TaxID=595528 RepID=A0A0D2WMM3_CAPO3|nr:cytochrome c oxidase assembly protein [Capsaspora owczarzaki ATCC 30864]
MLLSSSACAWRSCSSTVACLAPAAVSSVSSASSNAMRSTSSSVSVTHPMAAALRVLALDQQPLRRSSSSIAALTTITNAGFTLAKAGSLISAEALTLRIRVRGIVGSITNVTRAMSSTTAEASTNTSGQHDKKQSEQPPPRIVGFWLLGISVLTFATVVMGGVTRLTESGLSMVTWHPVHERPPSSEAGWEEEFEKYKQFPEYKMINKHMTLDEFKRIWYMEYSHRMFGRAVGAFFALPALAFMAKGWVPKSLRPRLLAIGCLIGFQGLLGWYMVKSGLDENLLQDRAVPRVSQYRLSAHLISAFVIYALTLWHGLNAIDRNVPFVTSDRRIKLLRAMAKGSVALVFLTAMSGAFVAGLDAGLVYNSFPKMADKWIPDDLLVLKPTIRNFFENVTTVQFDHRILGMTTLATLSAVFVYARKLDLPRRAKAGAHAMAGMALVQVTLGITTLLMLVPVPLAAAHQAGSLTLLTFAMYFLHTIRKAAVVL